MLNAVLPRPLRTVDNRWFTIVSDNAKTREISSLLT